MTALLNSLFSSLSPLWEMSLTAAYVTAVVVVLRLVLKKRAPKQVLCLLWLVVFARLLVPVSLESPLSILPDSEQVQLAQELPSKLVGGGQTAPVQDHTQDQPGGVTANSVSQGNVEPDAAPVFPVLSVPEGAAPSVPQAGPQSGFPWQALLAGVWLAGALAMGLYGLFTSLRLKIRLYDAIRAGDGAWEHPSVGSPFILGVIRPRIYLPAGLWGMPRKFILCHERAHLRRLDHIVKPICWAALALHWFNPAVWAAFILMSKDIEAACDEAVIRQLGPKVKADYSAALLSLATNGRVPAPCPLAFDEGDAKGRIQNVLRYRRPALWIVVVSVIMALMAAVCLLTDPVSAKEPDPDPSAPASQAPQGLNHLLDPWMEEVLNGERTFSAGGDQFDIHQLRAMVYGDEFPEQVIELGKLALMDLDRDGINEMVVWPAGENDAHREIGYTVGYFIFCRRGDEVRVMYAGWRPMQDLKADGTFEWTSSAWNGGISRLTNIDTFETEAITWQDTPNAEDNYFVDGLKATREEFEAACAAQDAKPEPTWYIFEDGLLREEASAVPADVDGQDFPIPVPDFLDNEQRAAYYQTYNVYSRLFGTTSEIIDPPGYGKGMPVKYNGLYYWPFTDEYADWGAFEALVKSVFTDVLWTSRGGNRVYVNIDGVTHYMDWARGSRGYNENFPETFRLVEQTDDTVSFIMTGYYSDPRQFMDASGEQIQAWLAAGWEYSVEYPMRMVKTADGWRFDQFYNARTDNGLEPSLNKPIPNPNAPALPDPLVYGPDDEVCLHGFDHIYVSTLDGTNNSTQAYQAHDTSMIFRCLEDGFTYVVPAPITGRDYWYGGGAEGDFDGDGRTEEAIVSENSKLLMICDAQDGHLHTCTVETGPMIDEFNQGLSYSWTDDGQTMTIGLSYQGQRIQAQFSGRERDLIQSYGDETVPSAAGWNSYSELAGQDIILSLPIYLSGSRNRDSTVLLGDAQWAFRYSGGQVSYVPGSFRLTAGQAVVLPASWTA